jgi:hypothetical protein
MKTIVRFAPHIFVLILCLYCWNVNWGGKRWKGFFLADSNGYYSYLPAVFIYHDLSFAFIDQVQKADFATRPDFDFRKQTTIPNFDKWYCGTALAIAPFFLLGHIITLIAGLDASGYSFWYAWALNIAAIFYCLAGLLALRKILSRYIENAKVIAIVLGLILFATNLFFYATSEPAMSHVYSFAFINMFVLQVIRYGERQQAKILPFIFMLLATIIIIRPVNGLIVLLLPFLAITKENMIKIFLGFRNRIPVLLLSLLAFACILSLQLVYYKIATGSFLVYSYGNESFHFLNPRLGVFLFSYKKGLFVYLPLILLSLTGFMFLYKKNKWQFYSLLFFVGIVIYILSCWWNWWYGGSFGTRPIVEYLFVFAILLAYTLNSIKRHLKRVFISFCLSCFLLCQVQTYQYRYYFIHWDEMNKVRYWNVFMRVDLIVKKENPNADLLNKSSVPE